MMYSGSGALRVTIAIPTYRRPDLLTKLLHSLPPRIEECSGIAAVDVLVVDNDAERSAEDAVLRSPLSVRYEVESTPGIASARNRLLDGAADSDLIAFIDDDEVPRQDWLPSLIEVWREHRPAAVMGRVISVFDDDVDPWILASRTFYRPPRPTGLIMSAAAAGNLLLDVEQIRRLELRFDESLGLAGGEDTLFSRQLIQRGGVIRWCNESETEDYVVTSRLNRTWVKQRAFSSANATARVRLTLTPGRPRRIGLRLKFFVGGIGRVVVGYARHLYGRFRPSLSHDARGVRLLHRGFGMIAGASGHHYHEYKR